MDLLESVTFDEIKLGDSASLSRVLAPDDAQFLVGLSSDVSATCLGTMIVALLGTRLPGPGTVILRETLEFRSPVREGETVTASVTATALDPVRRRITFACRCVNERSEVVVDGAVEVRAPTEKTLRPATLPPAVPVQARGVRLHEVITEARALEPIRTAVVHPVDRNALLGSLDAARAGLIVPVLVGPEPRIRAVASAEGVDLAPYRLVPTRHSHEAAERAVALVRAGEVEGLMKGSLHTDELMHEVVAKETGIRTARRLSHVFTVDVPTYPRLLFITDAAINVSPDLDAKRDIVQNAIDLARVLGIAEPKVAILSAVETLNPRIPSTIDAAALCKMAERRQITGGVLDGPLAFDNAVSVEAARVKGIESPVAGRADILVVPDLESGNMLAKQLEYLGEAQSAGIVLGARVPIVLTSRADSALARMTSCAVALLYARRGPRL